MLRLSLHILHPFRYAFGFFHPNTRVMGRLLGPCFKTGQQKPFWQNHQVIPHTPLQFLAQEYTVSLIIARRCHFAFHLRNTISFHFKARVNEVLSTPKLRLMAYNAGYNFSFTASFSTISSLLTLFSKFFSSFLRSTCMLSVSYLIFSLRRSLSPTQGSIPKLPDSQKRLIRLDLSKDGTFTLYGVLFQRTYDKSPLLRNSIDYNSIALLRINILGLYLFTRRY